MLFYQKALDLSIFKGMAFCSDKMLLL
uniref:Uncharacterized protein n=1 Tax=Anguilla anguilla TaxID=7936 RepID=A0A0E9P7G7_ANGAN